jgi:MYXO-CTERM domain-containing protein
MEPTMNIRHLAATGLLSLAFGAAVAAPLTVQSYSMPNGNGQAIGGARNYWDLCYGGACDKTTDNQILSGGTGDLTDGVVASQNWASVENVAGQGPYVGWHRGAVPVVSIDFFFGGWVDIDSLAIHADDSNGMGSVSLPASVQLSWDGGSSAFDVQDPATSSPLWLTFSDLGITGVSSVNLQLTYRTWWVFVDEVRFDGAMSTRQTRTTAIPEPSTLALGAVALATLVGARRRRARI